MPQTQSLPYALYSAKQVRHLDKVAIDDYAIPGGELMQRAGLAAFNALLKRWPSAKDITIVTGSGNNAGDGFVVASLAKQAGLSVRVLELGDSSRFTNETRKHAQRFSQLSGDIRDYEKLPKDTDIIVDAILGTGISNPVEGFWRAAIESINQHPAPVLSLDIPSGLNADSGAVMGVAVKAVMTISFIGLKKGMFTGKARDYCGDISFHALDIPARVYASEILSCRRIDWAKCKTLMPSRKATAHKGQYGHVLLIGGAPGFSGAIRLAGEAAARCGAGLVSIATHHEHAMTLNINRPEMMVHAVKVADDLDKLLSRATAMVFGPGVGQSDWSLSLLKKCLQSKQPLLLDADGLNLLAQHAELLTHDNARMIMTPHPGEAARLLETNVATVENDRFAAVAELVKRYAATFVLKGAGSLISTTGSRPVAVCSEGNPGMASGGMGDVLSGLIGALLAQGLDADDAACAGVCLHAAAADEAAKQGQIGMLASDLFEPVRKLLNA